MILERGCPLNAYLDGVTSLCKTSRNIKKLNPVGGGWKNSRMHFKIFVDNYVGKPILSALFTLV